MGLQLLVQEGDKAVGTFEVSAARYRIGRSGSNELALAGDSVISRHHAYIEASESGQWQLFDVSANGVLLNGAPLQREVAQGLADGDVIEIGGYQLTVVISDQEFSAQQGLQLDEPKRDPLELLTGDSGPGDSAQATGEQQVTGQSGTVDDLIREPVINEALDLPGFDDDPFAPAAAKTPNASGGSDLPDWARATGESPVSPEPSAPAQNTGQDPFAASQQSPPKQQTDPFFSSQQPAAPTHQTSPEPDPVPPPQANVASSATPAAWPTNSPGGSAADDGALKALATGLGLPADALANPQQAQVIGTVLKTLLAGVIDVLLNRAELKNQMKLQRTILQSQDNNPIKMAPNVESALRWLFTDQQVGFLDAQAAAADVMIDIGAHELSMIAGLQAAQDAVVKELNPDRLEKLFSEQVNLGGIGVLEKSRYWQLFRTFYENDVVNQDMMISTFAEAYEQMSQQVRRRQQLERGAQ